MKITVTLPHVDQLDPAFECEADQEMTGGYDRGHDGQAAGYFVENVPATCATCGYPFTEQELEQLEERGCAAIEDRMDNV